MLHKEITGLAAHLAVVVIGFAAVGVGCSSDDSSNEDSRDGGVQGAGGAGGGGSGAGGGQAPPTNVPPSGGSGGAGGAPTGASGDCPAGISGAGEQCDPGRAGCCEPPFECGVPYPGQPPICAAPCDLHQEPTGCAPGELCVPVEFDLSLDQPSPGWCIEGDECAPQNRSTCPDDQNGSCLALPPISMCLPAGTVGLGGACGISEPTPETLCEADLVCQYGRCKGLCDEAVGCPGGERCVDYGPRLDGTEFRFCHGSCDLFGQSGCADGEICRSVDEDHEDAAVSICDAFDPAQAPGDRVHGEACVSSESTNWGDCQANHLCVQVSEGDSSRCLGYCDSHDQSLCGGGSTCIRGLLTWGERVLRLGLCIGECNVLGADSGCPDGQVCAWAWFPKGPFTDEMMVIGTGPDGRDRPVGFCVPGDQSARVNEPCERDPSSEGHNCVNGAVCLASTERGEEGPHMCYQFCRIEPGVENGGCPGAATCETGVLPADTRDESYSETVGWCRPTEDG